MTTDTEREGERDLIIVRRRYDVDMFAHKGGVWKIAHADFMTAMMAFFLVMWLISTTDDQARKDIAQYFNPVKLAEMTPYEKGLRDPAPKQHGSADKPESEKATGSRSGMQEGQEASLETMGLDASGAATASQISELGREPGGTITRPLPTYTEAEIFSDPYGVLNRIMAAAPETEKTDPNAVAASGADARLGNKGGAALRDPFDPLYWQLKPDPAGLAEMKPSPDPVDASEAVGVVAGKTTPSLQEGATMAGVNPSLKHDDPKSDGVLVSKSESMVENSEDKENKADRLAFSKLVNDPKAIEETAKTRQEVKAEELAMLETKEQAAMTKANGLTEKAGSEGKAADISGAADASGVKAGSGALEMLKVFNTVLARELKEGDRSVSGEMVHVEAKGDGLLINVTDSPSYGMFAIGSSEPTARSIVLLEKIAKSLTQVKGRIIIRGHTDGRPFKSGESDNWRLSTARAHMARFMLIRGGLDETRLLRVEGYADTKLKVRDDPDADANRRIEILVQPGEGNKL